MPGTRMTLDHPVLASRRRTSYTRRSIYERRAVLPVRARLINDVMPLKPAAQKAKPALQAHVPRPSRSSVLKREAARRPVVRRKHHSSLKGRVLMGMAVILFVFGLGVGLMGMKSNQKVEAQVKHLSKAVAGATTENSDIPSETKPSAKPSDYKVAASMPRFLRISKIGVETRVLRTTVKANNQIGAPTSIFDAAWYDGSAKPGEAGVVLIDGHVSGPTQNGVFYNLHKMVAGDKIRIERGDGKILTYTVKMTKVYDASNVDMGAVLSPVTPGKPGLNIMTCTGHVDDSGHGFLQRLVVFAQQD